MVCNKIHYILLFLLWAQDLPNKKKQRKDIEEITKELLELIVEQR